MEKTSPDIARTYYLNPNWTSYIELVFFYDYTKHILHAYGKAVEDETDITLLEALPGDFLLASAILHHTEMGTLDIFYLAYAQPYNELEKYFSKIELNLRLKQALALFQSS